MAGRGGSSAAAGGGAGLRGSGNGPEDELEQNAAGLMAQYALLEYDIPLKNIVTAENSRQTNPSAVESIVESIKERGWMPGCCPQVMFPDVLEGQTMTAERAKTAEVVVIDGNHRVEALKKCYTGDFLVRCTCYRNISDIFARKIVSDVCNGATEVFSKRSTYDQAFLYNSLTEAVLAKKRSAAGPRKSGRNNKGEINATVSPAELSACWASFGGNQPTTNTLRQWLSIVKTTSTEALSALRDMTADRVEGYERVSKALLYDKGVSSLGKDKPEEQALVLQIYARWPKAKRTDVKKDIKAVLEQAANTMAWIEGIRFVVPKEQWSAKLQSLVREWAYIKAGHYTNYIQPHLEAVENAVKANEDKLPQHNNTLDPEDAEVVRSQQHDAVRKAMNADPQLKPYLQRYDQKHADLTTKVRKLHLQCTNPQEDPVVDKSGSNNSNDAGDETPLAGAAGSGTPSPVKTCGQCRAPQTSRYFCNVCDIRHTGGCANAEVPDGGDERKAERKCIDCNLSKRPYSAKRANPDAAGTGGEGGASSSPPGNGGEPSQNKGKKPRRNSGSGEHEKTGTSTTPLPRLPPSPGKSGDLMRVCKGEWTCVHDQMPFAEDFRVSELGQLKTTEEVMLWFIAPPANDRSKQDAKTWKERLNKIVYAVCDQLHPKGTVIAHIPQPYYDHATGVAESFRQDELELTLEKHGLIVAYGSGGGGVSSPKELLHLKGGVDHFIIAHRKGDDFTCQQSVLPQKFPEMVFGKADPPKFNKYCGTVMQCVPYLGASNRFHDNVPRWAIQRFTKRGDTVATLTGDKDGVIETAMTYGRRVEVFLEDPNERTNALSRIDDAFQRSWRAGHIPRKSKGGEVSRVKSGVLPMGLDSCTLPRKVMLQYTEDIVDVRKGAQGSPTFEEQYEASKRQVTKLAKDFDWSIQERDDVETLCARDNTSYKPNENAIPLWGELMVYDSPEEALDAISTTGEDTDLSFVRLVLVGDANMLSGFCKHGQEILSSERAGLYLRVHPTCPAYNAMWDADDKNTTHEVENILDRKWNTDKLLNTFKQGMGPISLNCVSNIASSRKGVAVKVHPGVSVVREGWSPTPASTEAAVSTPAEGQEE